VRDRERKQVKTGKKVNGVPVGGGVLGFFLPFCLQGGPGGEMACVNFFFPFCLQRRIVLIIPYFLGLS
jgi:hypothetical protein